MTNEAKVLVRWLDEGTADCLRDDGTGQFSTGDFAQLANVFVTTSVANAKRLVEDALINDEMLDSFDEGDGEWVTPSNDALSWDDEHAPQYAVEFKGEIVAIVYAETLNVLLPTRGPA